MEQIHHEFVALVSGKGDNTADKSPCGDSERNCRPRIMGNVRQKGLGMLCPQIFNKINRITGPLEKRPICNTANTSTLPLCELENRPGCNGTRCLFSSLDTV